MVCVPERFDFVPRERVEQTLADIGRVRAALIGDLCLDAYWLADMTMSELSRETPHFPLPVVQERYSPGAGGNAAANIAALCPQSVQVIGAVGQDWRADVLLQELRRLGIDVSGIIGHPGRVTNAYIKPCRRGLSDLEYEDPRLDFANLTPQPPELEEAILAALDRAAPSVDVLCVSDQFRHGCVTAAVREKLTGLARQGLPVVVDSRYSIGLFPGCILKPNELEAAAAAGTQIARPDIEASAAVAQGLARRAGSVVCMTLGGRGCLVAQPDALHHIPAVKLAPPLDICGAGDTFLAAFSCALAAGAGAPAAAYIATMASAVTVKKIGQTGTASRGEILQQYNGREPR